MENAEVSRIFRRVADLLEIEGANPFRIRAYRNAARTIDELPEPVESLARQGLEALDALPGVGDDLAEKIMEIVSTGTTAMLGKLERGVAPSAPELMTIPGIGAKRAGILIEKLGIRSREDLVKAIGEGRLHGLPGFGPKVVEKIGKELALHPRRQERMLRSTASQYAKEYLRYLRDDRGVHRAEVAGSFRRCVETVGDLDLLVVGAPHDRIVKRFVSYPEVEDVLSEGETRASVRLRSGLQVDLCLLDDEAWGAGLHYFTGSREHNIAVRGLGHKIGLKINEYGVFRGERRIGGAREEEVFAAVGLPWIPPELRENRGEIEAARTGKLPDLIELGDIRGDLQSHSRNSDGKNSIEEMAREAERMGYRYLAVTDHSPAVRITKGMDRAGFVRQMKEIDAINGRLDTLTILKGAEVDILADGTLDLDDDTLRELDVIVVSLHSKLALPEREQTRRIIRALKHPSVDIFGHPTGRLLGGRPGASFDLDDVLKAAADHGVMIEINAQPERLDLDDTACRRAIDAGVLLVISTDAHSTAGLHLMRWGVDQARRGWVERRHVANTLPLPEFRKRLHRDR